jgi:hypothetical protein
MKSHSTHNSPDFRPTYKHNPTIFHCDLDFIAEKDVSPWNQCAGRPFYGEKDASGSQIYGTLLTVASLDLS